MVAQKLYKKKKSLLRKGTGKHTTVPGGVPEVSNGIECHGKPRLDKKKKMNWELVRVQQEIQVETTCNVCENGSQRILWKN
jgi:hypothetical protein